MRRAWITVVVLAMAAMVVAGNDVAAGLERTIGFVVAALTQPPVVRVSFLALSGAACLGAIGLCRARDGRYFGRKLIVIGVLLAWIDISAVVSGSYDAFAAATQLKLSLAVGLSLALLLTERDLFRPEVLCGWAAVCVYGVGVSIAGRYHNYHFLQHRRWSGAFHTPNAYGCFAALSLAAIVSHTARAPTPSRFARVAIGIIAITSVAALVFSYSRSAWLGAALALGALAAKRSAHRTDCSTARYRRVMIGLAILVAATALLSPMRQRIAGSFLADRSVTNRLLTWEEGATMAAQKWLTGWGWAGWRTEFAARHHSGVSSSGGSIALNDYLNVAVDFGFVATAVYILAVAAATRRAFTDRSAELYGAVIVAMAPCSFYNTVIFDRQLAVFWWWALAAIVRERLTDDVTRTVESEARQACETKANEA